VSRCALRIALAVLGLAAAGRIGIELAGAQAVAEPQSVRFAAIGVYVESPEPLAAWQFELTESTGSMTVVGIENGDSPAFAGAPRYDLGAVDADRADRIVVADYSLAAREELPRGRTRVATVHVRLMGTQAPDFELELVTAGNADGRAIAALADLELDEGRAQ
jgi:hypothetical protein